MDIKDSLVSYLASVRSALIGKVEGVSERDARSPRTVTGTNLAGLLKHCAMIEHGYLVECLGQPSPLELPKIDFDADPNGDLYLTADESLTEAVARYRAVADVVGATVARLPLDTPATVPWWGERGATTLAVLLPHVLAEVARHAGQADIVREGIDGVAGMRAAGDNLWEPEDGWPAHVARLRALADGS
ncbi:MAG: DinB family protein [Tessaracoccus sp.]|uniref:DinB family protein n=1 Tax=Tessaracoccus sp. TaxID=1971211 RepID=UPI001ED01605|nr:DinB family protein [Tessaracoccus sp.]MBK7820788.1 DinB family protein [Tessaracoccus sp.]